jgi:hypothetical protein
MPSTGEGAINSRAQKRADTQPESAGATMVFRPGRHRGGSWFCGNSLQSTGWSRSGHRSRRAGRKRGRGSPACMQGRREGRVRGCTCLPSCCRRQPSTGCCTRGPCSTRGRRWRGSPLPGRPRQGRDRQGEARGWGPARLGALSGPRGRGRTGSRLGWLSPGTLPAGWRTCARRCRTVSAACLGTGCIRRVQPPAHCAMVGQGCAGVVFGAQTTVQQACAVGARSRAETLGPPPSGRTWPTGHRRSGCGPCLFRLWLASAARGDFKPVKQAGFEQSARILGLKRGTAGFSGRFLPAVLSCPQLQLSGLRSIVVMFTCSQALSWQEGVSCKCSLMVDCYSRPSARLWDALALAVVAYRLPQRRRRSSIVTLATCKSDRRASKQAGRRVGHREATGQWGWCTGAAPPPQAPAQPLAMILQGQCGPH